MHYRTKIIYGVFTSIFLIFFIISGIVLLKSKNTDQKSVASVTTSSTAVNNTGSNLDSSTVANSSSIITTGVTSAQLVSHNTSTDCWIVINNKVYDVSNYDHPKMDPFTCGSDNTDGWDSVNKHTTSLLSLVTYIGVYNN